MSATLKLTRQAFGVELRRGTFTVALDGSNIGTIERDGQLELPIEPGRHVLGIRAGRYSSRDHSFDVADGQLVNFRCHGANLWPVYVASIVKPDLAISLRRE